MGNAFITPLVTGYPIHYGYLHNLTENDNHAVIITEENALITFAVLSGRTGELVYKKKISLFTDCVRLLSMMYPEINERSCYIDRNYGMYSLVSGNSDSFSLVTIIKHNVTEKFYTVQTDYLDIDTKIYQTIVQSCTASTNQPLEVYVKNITTMKDNYEVNYMREVMLMYVDMGGDSAFDGKPIKGVKFAENEEIDKLKSEGLVDISRSSIHPILKQWEPSIAVNYIPSDSEKTKVDFSTGCCFVQYKSS